MPVLTLDYRHCDRKRPERGSQMNPIDSEDAARAEFEAWCLSERLSIERDPAPSLYADSDVDWMWVGWAARSRLAAATPVASPTEPKDCPHAAPFRYCETCKVSPCPVGLGRP